MAITAQNIVSLMATRGRGEPPSALADIFVNPIVRVTGFLDSKGDFSKVSQTVDDILYTLADDGEITAFAVTLNESTDTIISLLKTALDQIGSNFGLTRRPAATSVGTVLLYRSTVPSANIQVSTGKRVIAPSIDQEYSISQTIVIQPASMVYDALLNAYVYPAPIESVNIGSTTVAAEGQVSKISGGIAGLTGVTNRAPIVGGRNEEDDQSFGARIKTALSANNIGTESGYRTLVLGQVIVKDCSVVGAGNALMTRDLGDGGAIDIYVTNPLPVTITEVTTSGNVSGNTFTPARQPIIDDATTITVTGFSPATKTILKDTTAYAGSISSVDTITFDIAPPIGSATISYQVNDLVSRIQIYMDDVSRKILGADLMIKEAIITNIDVIMRIVPLPGFNGTTVKDAVETAVTQYLSALNIGVSLEQSDIIKIVTEVDGVDRVDLPLSKFDRSTDTGVLNTISASANEVLRGGTILADL